MTKHHWTATGCLVEYVPEGEALDELLTLVRIGIKFKTQHAGRRPGFRRVYMAAIVERMKPPITFKLFLEELDLESRRRAAGDGRDAPVEEVSRAMEVLKFHHPQRGRQDIPFPQLRNILTIAKRDVVTRSPKR